MRRHFLALLGGLLLLPPTASHAALTIDSFESAPFSMSVTTDGSQESFQSPSPAHCIASQRYTHLNWSGDPNTQGTATLTPLQGVDDAVILSLDDNGYGDLILEYTGGPWDLTDGGSNNRITLPLTVAGPGFVGVQLVVEDNLGVDDHLSFPVSVTGNYQFPFSEFSVDWTSIVRVQLLFSGGYDRTLAVRNVAATNGAAFSLLYDVWQPLTIVGCGPQRGGLNALAWNWGIVPSNPEIVAGTQLLVTGVGGQNCTSVSFQASDSGGGSGQLGEMTNVTVDWVGSSFDHADFEMRYATDPDAPFVAMLLGDPVVDFWDTGFVIRHEVHAGDLPSSPDGTVAQEFVVTPYPGQELYFDYVDAIPLPVEEGGYSLSFGVTGGAFDPGLPLLEMYTTGSYEDDGGVTSVVASATSSGDTTLRCVPTVSRTTSTLALARPSEVATSIDLYDVSGRLVRRLTLAAGARSVDWDGRASSGRPVGSGVYLARWTGGSGVAATATARVIRIR